MQKAQKGDYVTVEYEGALENGEIFESSGENGPLSFVIGQNSVFPSFEEAVIGLAPGESSTAIVRSGEAYGDRRQELIQVLNRGSLGDTIDPQPGMVIGMKIERDGQSHQIPATISEVDGDRVTIDYNHPLAGRDLHYRITLREIAGPEEPAPTVN